MNLSIFPKFCSNFSTHWLFPSAIRNIAICYCIFDKNNFAESDYEESLILLPDSLKTAMNKRKAEYLAGRICAREALTKFNHSGYPIASPDKSPLWPSDLCGSISHSHTIAAAVVSKKQDWQSLGIDIELLLSIARAEKLLTTVANQNEQLLMGDNIGLFTTLAFSIKESLFKALYPLTHKRFYFEHAEIIEWTQSGSIKLKLLTNLSHEWQKGQEIMGQYVIKNNYLWSFIGIPSYKPIILPVAQ